MATRIRFREGGLAGHLYINRSPDATASALAIMCPGLPYEPAEEAITPSLTAAGFDVIQLQYAGTYDSDGLFSPNAALATVSELCNSLNRSRSLVNRKNGISIDVAARPTLLVGHSFGSWVAARALEHVDVPRCVLIAPSLGYGRDAHYAGLAVDVSHQADYVAAALPYTFRLESLDEWRHFFTDAGGTMWRPERMTSDTKIWPVLGTNDDGYDRNRIRSLIEELRRRHSFIEPLTLIPHVGHDLGDVAATAEWRNLLALLRARD